MSRRNEASQTSEQFKRFRKLAEQLISVPRREVNAEKEKYEEKKREKDGKRTGS